MNAKYKAGLFATIAALFSGANAQEPESSGEQEREVELENIIVTGSRIRGAQNASPVVTITREEIDRAGIATVEELVEKLPQNFGAGAGLDTRTDIVNSINAVGGNVDNNVAGGTSVNLRGLGASSTLVLLNGRRLSPSGRSARFTNISSIPVSAIERVEVMTDGASAIYGSDAIGGVINFILRENYEGAETRVRYGSDSEGDTSNVLFGQTFGRAWKSGSVLLMYEYYESDNLANKDREITSTNDLRRFGGDDRRTPGGNPANIIAGGLTWAIPAGQDGTGLTAADFPVDASGMPLSPPNLYNSRVAGDILPEQERHSAYLHLTQDVGRVEFFAEAQFTTQETITLNNRGNVSFDVPGDDPATPAVEGNPFFVDPTGTGLTSVRVDNYSFENQISSPGFGGIDTFGAALGARFDLGEDWQGDIVGNWRKEEATAWSDVRLDLAALEVALAQSDPTLAFNPFGDGPNPNSVIESILDRSREVSYEGENELWNISLNANGSLFRVPGGDAQLAAGIDFREESLLTAGGRIGVGTVDSDLDRTVFAAYSELFMPLVSSENARPGMHRFEVSVAARYEDYDDFGDTVNPKIGVIWSPSESLLFRGTYGTSYRAPALVDMDVSNLRTNSSIYIPQLFVDLGIFPFTMIARIGSNEDLEPEEATTWTAGIEWTPSGAKGLSLGITYFDIKFEDRIDLPINDLALADDPRFSTLVDRNAGVPNDPEWLAQIARLVNDPRWNNVFGVPETDILDGTAITSAIFDARINNLSRSVVTGIELQLDYQFETGAGTYDFGLYGNYLFDFERAFYVSDPLVEEVDTIGRPVDLSARGYMTWSRNNWQVSGYLNYTDSYTDNVNEPARPVDSWTTVDFSIVYDTGDSLGLLSDTRLTFTVQNLLDEDPPFVNTSSGLAYDSVNGNPLGRMLSIQLNKDW